MAHLKNNTIPLRSKVLHRFYEPVVLLKALNHELRSTAVYQGFDSSESNPDIGECFRTLVYKLAFICDSIKWKGAATITSWAILKGEGGCAHHLFACNQRSKEELDLTQTYMVGILQKLGRLCTTEKRVKDAMLISILSDIIVFNEDRINYYLDQLDKSACRCQKWSTTEAGGLGESNILEGLELLIEENKGVTNNRQSDTFALHCSNFMQWLRWWESSETGQYVAKRAQEGRMDIPSQECWSTLQHMIKRLIAYAEATRFLIQGRERWPELFKNFRISYVESSERLPTPQRNKSLTAVSIVGRMTSKPQDMQTFRDFVQQLQIFGLDDLIKQEYLDKDFRPIVHSEVLLHDHLEKTDRLKPEHFFNGIMFIGSSKPTCKLCEYYFATHDSDVECRPSHGNIYLSWRFPDVLQSDGEAGEKKRMTMVDRVLQKVRVEAFDMVKKKLPSSYKTADSRTYSAALPLSRSSVLSDDGVGGLALSLARLNILNNFQSL